MSNVEVQIIYKKRLGFIILVDNQFYCSIYFNVDKIFV